ncbi:MAG: hypothetical protein JWM95_1994 [Gemmatimonadetes bacterium]|nr:hypothetical protein [Gemmatimonadota bacterium]
MIFRALARTFAALHVVFALFVMLGGLLVLRWPWLLWLHILAILWAAATLSLDLGCPLTAWEKFCLRRSGIEPYEEGFVVHYLGRAHLTGKGSQLFHITLGVGAIVLNVIIYTFIKR